MAGGEFSNGGPLGGKPCREGVDIVLRRAVVDADLLRRQPVVEVGGGGVLLIREELGESGLALRRPRENEGETQSRRRRGGTEVVGSGGPGWNMAREPC